MNISINKLPVTVLLAAKNEASNLPKCLRALAPAEKVYLLDSQSTDDTARIASEFAAETVQFYHKGGYPKKRQWAIETLPIHTEWILLIDADEVVPEVLWKEIRNFLQQPSSISVQACLIRKEFHFMGRKMRFGGFSHKAALLFRKGSARFECLLANDDVAMDMEVHERLIVQGEIRSLRHSLIHEDFKGLSAYIHRHNLYSSWEARVRYYFLTAGKYGVESIRPRLFGNAQEQRRFLKKIILRLPFEPLLWFLFHFVWKLGCLEGRRGLIASQIRSSYIAQARAKMYEIRLQDQMKARV